MCRFELVEGTSSKFWEVKVEGSELTVTFGRIGTHGQTKSKTFASNAAALAEETKLIKEKTGKGYKEVAATGVAGTTAKAPASAATPKPAMATAKPATAQQTAKTPPPTTQSETTAAPPSAALPAAAPSEIEWPSGGFVWDGRLRSRLPIIRGIHVPEFKLAADPLSSLPSFASNNQYGNARLQQNWAVLVQAGVVQSGAPWTAAEAQEKLKPSLLQTRDPDYWRELVIQCATRSNYFQQEHLIWAIQTAITVHSIDFATEVMLDIRETVVGRNSLYIGNSAYHFLRHALAAAPEDEHLAARRVAEGFRGRTSQLASIVSYLFPEVQEWAEDCVAQNAPTEWLLDETVMSVETACRHFRKRGGYGSYARPAALLQIHLHGEAAFPFLELLLEKTGDKDSTIAVLKLMSHMHVPALLPALVARMEDKEVRAALDELAEHWPAAILKSAVERAVATRSRTVEGWAVRLALRLPHIVEPALAACTAAERERFAGLLASLSTPEEASADALPELLRNPPWTWTKKPEPLPTLDIAPLEEIGEMIWPADMREQWRNYEPAKWLEQRLSEAQKKDPQLTPEKYYLRELGIPDSAHERVLVGGLLRSDDITEKVYYNYHFELLRMLPDTAAIAVWNSLPVAMWNTWSTKGPLGTMLARHELACLPGLVAYASANPEQGLALALPFRSSKFAPLAAHALKNLKKARANAMQWLRAHPETAITALIPPAFGKDRVPRENAQATLRWLAQNGFETEVRRIGAGYGEAAADVMGQLLGADPALMVPARMPKLPAFFVPAALRRPVLNSGGALPLSAVEHLGRMLTISTLHEPYAGLEIVKSACTRDSLAEFAWDVFDAWMSSGAPSRESWAFAALGLLGDDETARRLAPKIREWPGESAHARAVTGLDLLATIGSDVALMHLNGIANKVKFKGLQDKAKEKIAQVADARGLTPEELADRLVPDLGLDETGSVALDFGPRRFFVAFDEALKPYVKDEAGARLKDPPKPNRSDQVELAEAAVERYKVLKKDAKAIASLQIIRLEQIMCARRRWSGADFRLFFLDHPLMRHLARRLVWGVYRDGKFVEAFRVAEDLTLTDRRDDLYELPADVEVGIAHVLEMPEDLSRDLGQIFADYEILQPFRQLGRETYALTDEERRAGTIERFKARKVATGSVMGLINRGWERGEAQDGGWVGWFVKRLPGGLEAILELDPGTVVGDLSYEPEQTIPGIEIHRQGVWGNDARIDLAGLDPILVSEIIRDADLLAPLNKK